MNGCHDGDDPSEAELRAREERELGERVDRALDLVRDFLTPEEIEEHRRMLMFLGRTTPGRLSVDRPRDVPDRSGTVQKPDMAALRASVRWARGGSGELARILDEELSAYSAQERALFVGHFLDRETWEDLARDAGLSESTAKRRVASMRERLLARLRRRGVHRPSMD